MGSCIFTEIIMSDTEKFTQDDEIMVTVALPVLNGGALLENAVRSILYQSWSNWELLLLDDGSTDGAINRLTFLADPRIIVICDGQNLGLAYRLNQAVAMAKGKYFARMDHDDLCHPQRFIRQIAFLEEHLEVDLLATKCLTMDDQGRFFGVLPSAINHVDICSRPWQGFYMAHPSWMGRTEWFRHNPYKDPAPYCCEDQELLLRAHYSSCYHTIPEYLLAYRVRTQTRWKKQLRTRAAMGRIKFRHFLARRELLNAALSVLIELIRIGYDSCIQIIHMAPFPVKISRHSIHTEEQSQEWKVLTMALKDSTEHSKSN